MRQTSLGGALLTVLALAGPAVAGPEVTTFRLDNGMDVVVVEDHRVPIVNHMVWYRTGAADEPWGTSGVAHFLEHLLFKGTDTIPDGAFSKIVAANGGSDNAFTAQDYTGYFQKIAADRLDLVMGMEADRMRNLRLTEQHIVTERDVILEERSQRTDNSPQSLFYEQMSAALFQNHPYGIPVIGWRQEMEALDMEDALAFYRRFYAPDNAILVVAGDVTPDEVRALAEKHYGPIAAENRPPDARPQEPPSRAARRLTMTDPQVRQPYVMRFYLTPNRGSGDARTAAALEILRDVLGEGLSSRFASTLQLGDRSAIDTGAWYDDSSRDPDVFAIYAVPAPGVDLATVEAGLDAVLAEMAANGPTGEELDRAKRRMRASWIYAQDSLSSQARLYGAALATGLTVEDVEAWPGMLEAVTAEDVRAAARQYLVPERSVTGWLMQTPETEEKQG